MPHHRFRFGIDLHAALPGRSWADSARFAEDLGYSTLFVPDHFDEGLGPIAAMTAAAVATTTLRVGSLVLACDFRHPAVLARELATIDQLSGGRLEVGLGAGWKATDYQRSGITMDPPAIRVDRMIEHVTALRALFEGRSVTYQGDYVVLRDLVGTPSTATPGGPPILIGGGGRRVLRFAGRHADIVGVNASIHSGEIDGDAARDGLPDRIDEKVRHVRDGAGDRFASLELNAWLAAAEITDDRPAVGEALAAMFGVDAEVGLASPLVLVGSVRQVVEELQARRERWGYSYTVIPGDRAEAFAPVVAVLHGT